MALRHVVAVLRFVVSHPANKHRRVRAVIRAFKFQVMGRLTGRRSETPIGHSHKMWAVLHHTASAKALYANPPDYAEMQAWRKLLEPGSLFVDIGSNVGTYSLWAADCGAEVIAVEPAASSFKLLEANLALNEQSPVQALHCALADAPGEMWLTQGLDAMNHLVLDGTSGEHVKVSTLDFVLGDRTAAGVKIDVEGAERLVLAGGSSALAAGRIQALQLEWNELSELVLGETREPIVEMLTGYGYEFVRPDDKGDFHSVEDLGFGADLFAIYRP